ncbi:hypothetical protein CCAN12_770007 [Capnocytophaga canimorsus]|uniref:Uncharacterized protein n=1 Tax=Capnocytophaga canimorsus TaxID=28188 RepID=A0A0B7HIL1_9FLAO|nr:hypothetical protein CCAN12_770007 [Capnocytophaga canimorsus]
MEHSFRKLVVLRQKKNKNNIKKERWFKKLIFFDFFTSEMLNFVT